MEKKFRVRCQLLNEENLWLPDVQIRVTREAQTYELDERQYNLLRADVRVLIIAVDGAETEAAAEHLADQRQNAETARKRDAEVDAARKLRVEAAKQPKDGGGAPASGGPDFPDATKQAGGQQPPSSATQPRDPQPPGAPRVESDTKEFSVAPTHGGEPGAPSDELSDAPPAKRRK